MAKTQAYRREDFEETYDKYFDTLYRIAFLHIKRPSDSLDVVQDVFYKFLLTKKEFESEAHKKAWLITCAHNATMDYFRAKMRKNVSLDTVKEFSLPFQVDETIGVLLSLPEKYKTPLYMYYYEGYKTDEIAKILKKRPSTIRVTLHRGREILREKLGGDEQ